MGAKMVRVLVGEDDQSVLKVTKARLEHEGYEVIEAIDGEAILRHATDDAVQVILLDVWLPKGNGYEICRALKRSSATRHIPVIIFTASESQMQKLADRCIEAGATDWIKKPFRTAELLEKIHHALQSQETTHG